MLKAKIVDVAESSGVRAVELAWESKVQADPRERWSDVAVRAAEMWYAQTDQCSEAHVTVRIIGADGHHVRPGRRCASGTAPRRPPGPGTSRQSTR